MVGGARLRYQRLFSLCTDGCCSKNYVYTLQLLKTVRSLSSTLVIIHPNQSLHLVVWLTTLFCAQQTRWFLHAYVFWHFQGFCVCFNLGELQRKDVGGSFVWPRGHVCICLFLCTSCTFHREGFPLFSFWNRLLKLKSVPCTASSSSSSSFTHTDNPITPSRLRLHKANQVNPTKV